jgi:hypothetical protein
VRLGSLDNARLKRAATALTAILAAAVLVTNVARPLVAQQDAAKPAESRDYPHAREPIGTVRQIWAAQSKPTSSEVIDGWVSFDAVVDALRVR